MNAKEYLSQAMWLDKSINNKLEQMERLKAIAEGYCRLYSGESIWRKGYYKSYGRCYC